MKDQMKKRKIVSINLKNIAPGKVARKKTLPNLHLTSKVEIYQKKKVSVYLFFNFPNI